jgi:hypothetical protein
MREARLSPGDAPGRSRVFFWAPLAAAAVILLVVGINLMDRRTADPEPVYRDLPGTVLHSLIAPDARLSRADFVLRWEGPEGARYSLRIATEDLRVLDQIGGLTESAYHVPEDLLADVPSGERVVWQVQARLPDGTRPPPLIARTIVE